MATTTRRKGSTVREDGRVVLHVFVHPDVRRGIHVLSSLSGGDTDGTLRRLVRDEMERQKLPALSGLDA